MQGNQLAILVRQAPYTTIAAAEAVRHAGGALGEGLAVTVLLVDEGVLLARDGQDSAQTGFVSLSAALRKVIEKGAQVFALDEAAERYGLRPVGQLMEGVALIDGAEVARQLASAGAVMVY